MTTFARDQRVRATAILVEAVRDGTKAKSMRISDGDLGVVIDQPHPGLVAVKFDHREFYDYVEPQHIEPFDGPEPAS